MSPISNSALSEAASVEDNQDEDEDEDSFAVEDIASEDEEDMLDLAAHVQPTSRLACQLTVSGSTMTVRIPG